MPTFADLLCVAETDDAARHVDLYPDFMQGRTVYGGLLGALCVRSMRRHVSEDRPLRSLMIALAGPVGEGSAELDSAVLRVGRALTQVRAHILQRGSIAVTALASFGGRRPSSLEHEAQEATPRVAVAELAEFPYAEGLAPAFSQHFEYRWPDDAMPYSGRGTGITEGWLRFRSPIPAAEPFLVALGDAWPAPAMPMLDQLEAVSTVTWSLELMPRPDYQSADGWWSARARLERAEDGYTNQETRYWDERGRLALISRQVVAVYGS